MTDTQPSAPPQSTRSLLRGIWGHLSRRRRIQLWLLLPVSALDQPRNLANSGTVE